MTYGLTSTGFVVKRLSDALAEILAAYSVAFDIPVEAMTGDTVLGQLAAIHAEREADLWALAAQVYHSAFPDTAEGVPLENVGAIVGVGRLRAIASTTTVLANGTAGTLLTAGQLISVTGTGDQFATLIDATIEEGGSVSIPVEAVETGPIAAPAGTLITIVTPVSGWDTVTNGEDAEIGRNRETDSEYRSRRADSLVVAGGGTTQAIENRITDEVEGVTFCVVTENRTDYEDGDGLPPHSQQIFVIGGDDTEIAQKYWDVHSGGITSFGTETAYATDSEGTLQPVSFSRGTDVPMYLAVHRTTNAQYPAGGDALIKAALVAYVATLSVNDDVFNWLLKGALFSIPGITGLTIYQGIAPTPVSEANTTISSLQRATLITGNISVGA